MKIGILTQPIRRNYGGILQNWALQQILKNMGHEPEMIWRDYNVPPFNIRLIPIRIMSFIKCLYRKYIKKNKNVIISNPFAKEYITYPECMDYDFVNQISRSPKCRDDIHLQSVVKSSGYEAFIVGSDQVWRTVFSPNIKTYFLDFLNDNDNRRRIAYAASFGIEKGYMSKNQIEICKPLLKRFEAVSVRESSGINILKRDFDRWDGVLTLDPTLLLDKERYESLITPSNKLGKDNISVYVLDPTSEKEYIATEIANHYGKPYYAFSCDYRNGFMLSVSDWLTVLKNSAYVLTDSFHGMVFSILFNKDFTVVSNKERGIDRFSSLLEQLGLTERMVGSYSEFKTKRSLLLTPIDYSSINSRLKELRNNSINWLKDAINGK